MGPIFTPPAVADPDGPYGTLMLPSAAGGTKMDNYGTHTHPTVKAWLDRHPRFVPHFVPTSASWLNLVERWFGELTSKRIRRDSFHSVDDLIAAIEEFLAAWNDNPKPFLWTATVDSIVDKLARCRQTLEQIQPGCTRPKAKRCKKRLSS